MAKLKHLTSTCVDDGRRTHDAGSELRIVAVVVCFVDIYRGMMECASEA
jgi:hypothetical protein